MADELNSGDERRRFFRIDDTLGVDLLRLSREELASRVQRLEKGLESEFTVLSSLAGITAEAAVHLRRIQDQQPDVAAYLKALDRKLEILGRAVMAQDADLVAERACPVNLSAGGISLEVAERYEPRDAVEVRMLLFPAFTGVLAYGDVVSCEPLPAAEATEERRFRLRVEFTYLREPDREVLIRHVLRRQGDELRARRQQP